MNAVCLDRISEAIAHFIGLFGMAGEEARLRHAYDEFRATHKVDEQFPDHLSPAVKADVACNFDDFDPDPACARQAPAMVTDGTGTDVAAPCQDHSVTQPADPGPADIMQHIPG